jgi:hypothetical protein
MKARQSELAGKIFSDKNGNKYEGQRFIDIFNPGYPTGFLSTEIHYFNGRIHGSPAIIYPDGLEEEWREGSFVKTLAGPYSNRQGNGA